MDRIRDYIGPALVLLVVSLCSGGPILCLFILWIGAALLSSVINYMIVGGPPIVILIIGIKVAESWWTFERDNAIGAIVVCVALAAGWVLCTYPIFFR